MHFRGQTDTNITLSTLLKKTVFTLDLTENIQNYKITKKLNYRKRTYFWKKPMTRTYHYNLNVGENYYTPMTAYLESLDRGAREQSPGALTFDERLYRDWQRGHRYGEYGIKSRASSLTRYEAGNVGSTYVDRWARASTQGINFFFYVFTLIFSIFVKYMYQTGTYLRLTSFTFF